MDVAESHNARHSEIDFVKQFLMMVDSGAGVIHVRASEVLRAVSCIRRAVLLDKSHYLEWDVVNGNRVFTLENCANEAMVGDNNGDISDSFSAPLGVLRDNAASGTQRFFLYVNPHVYMESNPHMHQLMLMYNEYLPTCGACVVMVTPDAPLPETPASDGILAIRFTTPGARELKTSLIDLLENAASDFKERPRSDEDLDLIVHAGAGMTKLQFETAASLAAVKAYRDGDDELTALRVADEVKIGKTEIVNSSDILELYKSSDIGEVGGMENLKDWVARRARCYSDEAREFGVEPPKGMVLVGPPGTGKSLVAKAIAGELGVPLVRMDFGRVFSSFVGSSEQRIRTALNMVESMAPCVLFCDEIDKGLGGISSGGGGDSGVSMRVLGSFLTWLQDCEHPVFTMVTANNIDGLPPELMRRGRFDAIFSTALPTDDERRQVLDIHLHKRGREIEDFPADEIAALVETSRGYVPAELESVVKDALVDAYDEGSELRVRHMQVALDAMVPLSKSFAAQIERMNSWAQDNATPVSRAKSKAVAATRQRVTTRRRTNP